MPDNTKKLYKITHSSPEIETVGDFLNDRDSAAHSYLNKPDDFLNIVGADNITNRERITDRYMPDEQGLKNLPALKLPLKCGTILYVEFTEINDQSFATEGIEVVSTSDVAFKSAALAALEADAGYYQYNHPKRGQHLKGLSKEIYPECTVWIFLRSLSPKSDEDSELTGAFFDLTPFIIKCESSVSKNGGNFKITLPPLTGELDSNRKWVLKKTTIDKYENKKGSSLQGDGYVASSSIFHSETFQENPNKAADEELVRNQFFFANAIGQNDLIFIRYETLKMESEQRYADSKELYIDKSMLAGRIFDLIGLVDSNTLTVNPANNDVSINITGRDLSKLFLEDGVNFFPLEMSQGLLKFAGQSEQKNSQINRMFGDGALSFITLFMHSSIKTLMQFIIQQLANIKIVPNGLFNSWGNRINYRFNNENKLEPANGIWKIIKLICDESISQRRIQDSSFSTAQGSLMNFIHKVVADPLAEVIFDTVGDMYFLTIRKPPTDQKSIISMLEGRIKTESGVPDVPPAIINVEQEDVIQESLSFDETSYSWFHFFPANNFFGDAKNYSLSYLGALFFQEYADGWGAKTFQMPHPYLPFVPLNNSEKGLGLYEKQAIQDLKYVVESSQYLPFSRKGTLVLNPDRRIKIGSMIRYKSTGEIFMVDAVQQNYQITDTGIERTTVVNVSRGLIEQLIYGTVLLSKDSSPRFVSYFNIINTDLVFNYKETTEKITKRRKKPGTTATNSQVVASLPVSLEETIIESGNKGLYQLEKYNKWPENKRLFIRFINGINKLGYDVFIQSTNRSYAEQAAIKRKNTNNAKPGHSRHERGAAIDINIMNRRTGKWHRKITSKEGWIATGVPALAQSMGLSWADGKGSGQFGSYIDRVHFQISGSRETQKEETITIDEFEEYTEEVKSKGLDRDAVFSNFKVNQFVFNFFHKRLQFDPQYRKVTSRKIQSNSGILLDEVKLISPKRIKK